MDGNLIPWSPTIVSANTILATEYPPPCFLVPGILPDSGLIVLAASKAAGKTWVLLQMAAAVALGDIAFGQLLCQGARVLFLELELSQRRIHERFARMCLKDIPGLDFSHSWATGVQGLQGIETEIKKTGYGLVIVDVLARLWPRGTDMNDYGSVYDFLGPLRDMAYRLGVCIVLATHTRKSEAEDAIDQVMGSVGIVGTSDVILGLKRPRGSKEAILRADGNDIESLEYVLRFDTIPMGFTIVDADPVESRLTPERKEVLQVIRTYENGAKAKEIAEKIGKDADVVSKHLRALEDVGLAEKLGYGVYKASRSGRSSRNIPVVNDRNGTSPTASTTPTIVTSADIEYGNELDIF